MSGVVRVALELAKEQAKRGHDVYVATVGPKAWKTNWNGVTLLSLASAPWAKVSLLGRSVDFCNHMPYAILTQRHNFDVVQGHLYNYLRFLRAKARVLHVHTDPYHKGYGTRDIAFKPADVETIVRYSDCQVGVSHFVSSQLRRLLGAKGNVHVIHNGVDADRFAAPSHKLAREQWRQRWGVGSHEPVFLYSGAIVPEKGVIHLARAFASLARRSPHMHLVLAGSSSLWGSNGGHSESPSEYEQAVSDCLTDALGRKRVHFLGKVCTDMMPGVYAAADALVVPSVWQEPFPLSLLEAMAAGLPVIASQVGGIPEIVTTRSGLLLPPGDERALELAIAELARKPDHRRLKGQAALTAVKRLSWESTADRFEQLYLTALFKKRKVRLSGASYH